MGAAAIFSSGLSVYVKRAFSRYPPADRQGAGWGMVRSIWIQLQSCYDQGGVAMEAKNGVHLVGRLTVTQLVNGRRRCHFCTASRQTGSC